MNIKLNESGLPKIVEKANDSFQGQDKFSSGMRLPAYMTRTMDSTIQSPLLNSRKQSTLIRIKQGAADPIGNLLLSNLDDPKPEGDAFEMMKIRDGQAYDASYRPKIIRKTPF
jgi:hypothetical protein